VSIGPAGVTEFRLANGLQVVLAPQATAPTASVWVWYRVGSRNEQPGITGASHWVEHMLFNGSPHWPKGSIDRAVVETGGYLNAFTDTDVTAYLTTVPASHVDLPLRIEADRMTRATIAPKEVDREREIVLSERMGNENWPEFRAEEELMGLAFRQHSYRWDPLGYPEDIRNLSAAALKQYYLRFYGPKNAILVVAGGFPRDRIASRIRSSFSALPATGEDPTVRTVEPPAHAERRATIRGPGTTPFFTMGWRAAAFHAPSTPALVALDVLLGGETRLFSSSMWGPRGDHPSSRLYRRLVDTGLAIQASSGWSPRVDPGLFTIHAQAAPGVPLDRVEKALHAELDRVAATGPTSGEITDMRRKLLESTRLAYEGPTRTAARLGHFAVLGGQSIERRLLRDLLRISPAAVQKVARELFRPEARSVVEYLPDPRASPVRAG
jgi:zinc protease